MEKNIIMHDFQVTRNDREQSNGHVGKVLWFTGLSGSGKSTITDALQKNLFESKKQVTILDGDSVRHGLCHGLGFSQDDRAENLRRVAEVAKLLVAQGVIVLCSFISPLRSQRELTESIIGKEDFTEIHISTPLDICEKRDPKGLYKKARAGEIPNFTGIDSAYEKPLNPICSIDNSELSVEDCVEKLLKLF